MKVRRIRKSLLVVSLASISAAGCELIVDFDRTKIPVEASDSSLGDVVIPETGIDTGLDAGQDVASPPDADAGDDADAAADADADA